MSVDKSLSRGLADRVIDEVKRNCEDHLVGCKSILARMPRRRRDVMAQTQALVSVGERCSLTQVVGSHPKWRWSSISVFLPMVVSLQDFDATNRTIAFRVFRMYLHVDREPCCEPMLFVVLLVQEHAVERMFQRMNLTEASEIRSELHDAMCMSLPVLRVCRIHGLRQIALPTRSGVFLCSVTNDDEYLIARTWVANSNDSTRYHPVVESVYQLYEDMGGERGVAEQLAAMPAGANVLEMPIPDASARRLADHRWLTEEYKPRADPVGETWKRAREAERKDRIDGAM